VEWDCLSSISWLGTSSKYFSDVVSFVVFGANLFYNFYASCMQLFCNSYATVLQLMCNCFATYNATALQFISNCFPTHKQLFSNTYAIVSQHICNCFAIHMRLFCNSYTTVLVISIDCRILQIVEMGDCKKHLYCLVSLFYWTAITVAITFDL